MDLIVSVVLSVPISVPNRYPASATEVCRNMEMAGGRAKVGVG